MSDLLYLPPNPFPMPQILPEDVKRMEKRDPTIPKKPEQCPTCDGKKTFRWLDEQGEPALYECDCRSQVVLTRYLATCGLGRKHQQMTWSDVVSVPDEALKAVLDYADQIRLHLRSGSGLVLRSPANGTGKTMLAVLLLKKIIAMGHDGYFVTFHDLLDQKSAGWRSDEEQDYFNRRIRNAGVLVIDDVGKENTDAGSRALGMHQTTFDQVLRARYNDNRPTILTTNETAAWWSQHYQGAIMSLLEGASDSIDVDGLPWRGKERERTAREEALGLSRPVVLG